MPEHPCGPIATLDEPHDAVEARVRAARELYHGAVAAYLSARDEAARTWLGDAMYFAQLATIEARFNPQGCARFRALAEARLGSGALAGEAGAGTLRQAA